MRYKIIIYALLIVGFISCGGGDSGDSLGGSSGGSIKGESTSGECKFMPPGTCIEDKKK